MKTRLKYSPGLLVLGILLAVSAAQADDEVDVDATYFHPAASYYIHGDSSSASNLVARGLALYPDDGKLKRLKDLLEQQQEQQQQENEDNQQGNPEQQPEENEPSEQENEGEQEEEPEQNQPPEEQPAEPENAEQMSEDEAKQLLDAMRQEEKNKRLQLKIEMGTPVKVDKDW